MWTPCERLQGTRVAVNVALRAWRTRSPSINDGRKVSSMTYVERLVPSPLASCTWEQSADAPYEQRIVPDACVDLIWSGDRLTIAYADAERLADQIVGYGADVRVDGPPEVREAVIQRLKEVVAQLDRVPAPPAAPMVPS